MALFIEPLGQLHRILQGTARMGGDEVGHQILVLAIPPVELKILFSEFFIYLNVGLSHVVQSMGHTVLRRHLELARDVVLDQVGKKLPAGVLHQIVKPDAGSDEHLFHLWDLPQLCLLYTSHLVNQKERSLDPTLTNTTLITS